MVPPSVLEAIARFARARDLWVLADEVYEELVFPGHAHRSIAALPEMAARTVTVFSLSKTYALAGLRLGYVVADAPVMHAIRKIVNHTVYNVPAVLQRAGLDAMIGGGTWTDEVRATYLTARDLASGALKGIPHFVPDGGVYLLLDLRAIIGSDEEEAVMKFHDRLLDGGVALSPGLQFGTQYRAHARLCFTALPLERMEKGVTKLRELVRL